MLPRGSLSFAALRTPQFRWLLGTFTLAMMADNIEHVITYWVIFREFQSPALGGFAVLSHWLPYLLFSFPLGALADRIDARPLVLFGMALFVSVSLGWGYFFLTDTLEMWHATVLLVLHGCAGVCWIAPGQMLLHRLVADEDLQSAIRLSATGRYLGVLAGPAIGAAMLFWLGPITGMFLNACFYIPAMAWLMSLPARRAPGPAQRIPNERLGSTLRVIANRPAIATMTVLCTAAAALVGNSYQAQMPIFAIDLGQGDPDGFYAALLAADAAGALVGGLALEASGKLNPGARLALLLALAWCAALAIFAVSGSYALALGCLFVAGFFELAFSSMAQTVVQLEAPNDVRGRILGVFATGSLGFRAFSGITVGLLGVVYGVHVSLALSCAVLFAVIVLLLILGRGPTRKKTA
ncbi:MAG: MFS transporter [Hyphomonadaceae bacterium]|nr:MFS transporter [Hyphomonadaceae bacterium]